MAAADQTIPTPGCCTFYLGTHELRSYGHSLVSTDSTAWSIQGCYIRGCTHRQGGERPALSEANCSHFAEQWRRRLLDSLEHPGNINGGEHA